MRDVETQQVEAMPVGNLGLISELREAVAATGIRTATEVQVRPVTDAQKFACLPELSCIAHSLEALSVGIPHGNRCSLGWQPRCAACEATADSGDEVDTPLLDGE